MSAFFSIFEDSLEIIFGRNKRSRLIMLLLMTIMATLGVITIVFSEIKKQDITKSQLEIEKNRINQIDKQLSSLYIKTYRGSDSIGGELIKTNYLKEIEFLKSQREEALKSFDKINNSPDTQIVLFTLITLALTILIVIFFSSSFKSSNYIARDYERLHIDNRKSQLKNNIEFINWITTNEIAQNNLNGLDIEKAKSLKEIYDISETLGEDKNTFLRSIIKFTNLKRKQEEIEQNKHSEILLNFENIQNRLRDECNRLNKQALINLFICFFIAFIVIGYITYSSLFSSDTRAYVNLEFFFIKYIPRIISIASLLTMFLYFVRLYKTNIIDVKYYHNELTNVEVKLIALQTALIEKNENDISHITKEFSLIERNNLINAEQSTSELERIKIENEINKGYLEKVWELIGIVKNK